MCFMMYVILWCVLWCVWCVYDMFYDVFYDVCDLMMCFMMCIYGQKELQNAYLELDINTEKGQIRPKNEQNGNKV